MSDWNSWNEVTPKRSLKKKLRWEFWFDNSGEFIREFPDACIQECSAMGPVDEAVDFWQSELDFQVPPAHTRKWLRNFGAWDQDELNAMDETELAKKVLWIACGDLNENGDWFGLIF